MPRAFLVKKPCVSTCKRNWSELPDEERGEIYVPGEAPAHGPGASRRPPAWGPVGAADVQDAAMRSTAVRGVQPPDLIFKRTRPR